MRAIILLAILLPAAAAAAGTIEQALGKAGLGQARIERTEDQIRVSCTYGDQTLDEPALRQAIVAAMLAIKQAHGSVGQAVIDIALADGQVMQVAADPRLFRADMGEIRLLRSASVRFLTRGPALTPAPCTPRMSCKRDPERCPCEPGSLCEPDDKAADRTGCISVRASQNAEVRASGTVCKPGHTWDEKGFDCVPGPSCGADGLEHGDQCLCPPGIEQNAAGGCGPLAVVAPDAGPPRLDAGAPVADGGAEPGGASSLAGSGFARWVWQAMAGGVVLSVPIALFLLGSILRGLRSRRWRIGLRKYCIHCGRKLAMEDTRCRKCKTEQP